MTKNTTKPASRKSRHRKRNVVDVGKFSAEAQVQLRLHFLAPRHWSDTSVAACCPPGSLLSKIAQSWFDGTSIPLEMPVAMALTIISGELAARNVQVVTPSDTISPELWYCILAPSGCGKTWTLEKLQAIFGTQSAIDASGCVSSAALWRVLSEKSRGYWACDEWGAFLKQIEAASSPLSEAKAMLLKIYSGHSLTRDKAQADARLEIRDPAVALCGVTVDETFRQNMTQESLLDGFGSRFCYAYGRACDIRPWYRYPTWAVRTEALRDEWEQISGRILPTYECNNLVTSEFEAAFERLYQVATNEPGEVIEAFFRRCLYRHHKLALICHILTDPENPQLTVSDYDAAERLVAWQLRDGRRLINTIMGGELYDLVERSLKWVQKRRTAGEVVNTRALLAGVRGIDKVAKAEFVMSCIREEENYRSLSQEQRGWQGME